jgi:uncharacterized protein YbjT (DUF2867 family)
MTYGLEPPKTVTVMGATGNQGGSVVRSLAQNKSLNVRGVTRDPSSKASQNLVALGVEVVKADGWNQKEITAAFAGSWAAFVNTNSDDPVCQFIPLTNTLKLFLMLRLDIEIYG